MLKLVMNAFAVIAVLVTPLFAHGISMKFDAKDSQVIAEKYLAGKAYVDGSAIFHDTEERYLTVTEYMDGEELKSFSGKLSFRANFGRHSSPGQLSVWIGTREFRSVIQKEDQFALQQVLVKFDSKIGAFRDLTVIDEFAPAGSKDISYDANIYCVKLLSRPVWGCRISTID